VTTTARADSPGIPFPPPLVYVAPLALGFLLHRVWPLRIGPPPVRPAIVMLGWALVAVWVIIQFPAYYLFFRSRTSLMPNQPAKTVVNGDWGLGREPSGAAWASSTLRASRPSP
jgi:hypothetical protein